MSIELFTRDSRGIAIGAALGGVFGVAMMGGLQQPPGTYATLQLPTPAPVELFVRARADALGPDFDDRYQLDTLVPKLAKKFLGNDLRRLLAELWSTYRIGMKSDSLEIGPFAGTPQESARVVHSLVRALPSPAPEVAIDESVSGDEFCFYCGAPVAAGTRECPYCEGDLSSD